jgi:hypothetical protein
MQQCAADYETSRDLATQPENHHNLMNFHE